MRRAARILAVVLALAATGCASLPTRGPLVRADATSVDDPRLPSDITVAPPLPDAAAVDVVRGFLDAMTASPSRLDLARLYLTRAAGSAWNPTESTILYAAKQPPRNVGTRVEVRLTDADRLDVNGTWRGGLSGSRARLSFQIAVEDGQYRISDPPDALIVPTPWFAQRYSAASLYFFDRTARVLVPEPVFVPRGEQLASALIEGLLRGPASRLAQVERSFLPDGLTAGLSVTISESGVAEVRLDDGTGNGDADGAGASSTLNADTQARIFAQLAWTLRQDPDIESLRVTLGGVPLRGPDDEAEVPIGFGPEFDPAGYGASPSVFGLSGGRLALLDGATLEPLTGLFSVRRLGLDEAAVDLSAERAAALTDDGRLLVAPLSATTGQRIRTVAAAAPGDRLLRPSWDVAGRLWWVEQTRTRGAIVRFLEGGRVRRLQVPGVSRERVRVLMVSRDGSRLAAVVRRPGGDLLRVSRVAVTPRGRVDRALPAPPVVGGRSSTTPILDIAWRSPTSLLLLSPVRPGELAEVRSVGVDGAPLDDDALAITVAGRVVGLVGSPATDDQPYAVLSTGLVGLDDGAGISLPGDVASLSYPG